MRKTTILWVLFGVLGLLLLCGLSIRHWYICSWQGLCPLEQVSEKNGVQLIVYSAKRKYVYKKASLYFRVTVRNVSEAPVILRPVHGSRGNLEPAIRITLDMGETILWHEQHPEQAYREIVLSPGDELVFEFRFPPGEWEPVGGEAPRIVVAASINVFTTTEEPPQRFFVGNTIIIPIR